MDAPLRSTTKQVAKQRKANFRLLIRRTHLYSGLFLVPWVMLYGFTAFLFNHPNALSSYDSQQIPLPTSLEQWSDANGLADAVISEVSQSLDGDSTIGRVGQASFTGSVFARLSGETAGSVRVDLNSEAVKWRTKPGQPEPPPGPLDGVFTTETGFLDKKSAGLIFSGLLESQNMDASARVRSIPSVEFDLSYQGQIWRANYDLENGELKAKLHDDMTGPNWRTFLLRLHMVHVYSDHPARWIWTLIVDIMAFAMMMWAGTGVYMWWQMKKLRGIGKIVVAISVSCALALGYAMYLTYMR